MIILFYHLIASSILIKAQLTCPPGYGISFDECEVCPVGEFSLGGFNVSCTLCTPGTYSNASASTYCFSCEPGSHMPYFGYSYCEFCAFNDYSTASASIYCDNCPLGTVGPQGSTSPSNCENAVGSYVFGVFSLFFLLVFCGGYIFSGHIHWIAFLKRENIILPLCQAFFLLSTKLKVVQQRMSVKLGSDRTHVRCSYVKAFFVTIIALVSSCILFTFNMVLTYVFLCINFAVLWRGYRIYLPYSFLDRVNLITDNVRSILPASLVTLLQPLWDLLIDPILSILDAAFEFEIHEFLLNAFRCIGCTAHVLLSINALLVCVLLVTVESDACLFWSTHRLTNSISLFWGCMTRRIFRKRRNWVMTSLTSLVLSAIPAYAVQYLMIFLVGMVNVSAFFASRDGHYEYSPECGYTDYSLAISGTVLLALLSIPYVYLFGKICSPLVPRVMQMNVYSMKPSSSNLAHLDSSWGWGRTAYELLSSLSIDTMVSKVVSSWAGTVHAKLEESRMVDDTDGEDQGQHDQDQDQEQEDDAEGESKPKAVVEFKFPQLKICNSLSARESSVMLETWSAVQDLQYPAVWSLISIVQRIYIDELEGRTCLGGLVWSLLRFLGSSVVLGVEAFSRLLKVSVLGLWADSDVRFFDIVRKDKLFNQCLSSQKVYIVSTSSSPFDYSIGMYQGGGGGAENAERYSRFLQSFIGMRCVFFMLCPYLTALVPYAVLVSGHPIFVHSPTLQTNLSPLFSPFDVSQAEQQLKPYFFSPPRWASCLRACENVMVRSRMVQYLYRLSFCITATICILLPETLLAVAVPFVFVIVMYHLVCSCLSSFACIFWFFDICDKDLCVAHDTTLASNFYSAADNRMSTDSSISYRGISLHDVDIDDDDNFSSKVNPGKRVML